MNAYKKIGVQFFFQFTDAIITEEITFSCNQFRIIAISFYPNDIFYGNGDVLFTSPWRGEMQFGDLFIDGTGGWESRQVRLNLSYAFGNNEVKKSRRRKTGLEDENSRVGN